jgi:hypothetical protein
MGISQSFKHTPLRIKETPYNLEAHLQVTMEISHPVATPLQINSCLCIILVSSKSPRRSLASSNLENIDSGFTSQLSARQVAEVVGTESLPCVDIG